MKILTYEKGLMYFRGVTIIVCEKCAPMQDELENLKAKHFKLYEDHTALQDQIIRAYKKIAELEESKPSTRQSLRGKRWQSTKRNR